MSGDWSPDCWTPNILTKEEMTEICNWLGKRQAAAVTYNSLAADFDDAKPMEQLMDPDLRTAMRHMESLIRHIHGLKTITESK